MTTHIKAKVISTTSFSFLGENPLAPYLSDGEKIKHRMITNNVVVYVYTSLYNTKSYYDIAGEFLGEVPMTYNVIEPEMKFITTKDRVIYGKIQKLSNPTITTTYIVNLYEEVYEPFLFFFKQKVLKMIGSELVKITIEEEPINLNH